MATTAQRNKAKRTPKFATRIKRRCELCGRPRGGVPQVPRVQDLSA